MGMKKRVKPKPVECLCKTDHRCQIHETEWSKAEIDQRMREWEEWSAEQNRAYVGSQGHLPPWARR